MRFGFECLKRPLRQIDHRAYVFDEIAVIKRQRSKLLKEVNTIDKVIQGFCSQLFE